MGRGGIVRGDGLSSGGDLRIDVQPEVYFVKYFLSF